MSEKECGAVVWSGFRSYKCCKKAKVERNGLFFCGTHDPVARAAKQEKRVAKSRDKFDADVKKNRIRNAAPELLAALQSIVDASDSDAAAGGEMWWAEVVCPFVEAAKPVIAKALGESA